LARNTTKRAADALIRRRYDFERLPNASAARRTPPLADFGVGRWKSHPAIEKNKPGNAHSPAIFPQLTLIQNNLFPLSARHLTSQ
jgi:hypothetical protein